MDSKETDYKAEKMAGMIDSTLLKPEATAAQIDKLCSEAMEYHFASVCVHPCHIRQAAERLSGSGVTPCSVAGFPFGTNTSAAKAFEAAEAISLGAKEVDMVMNIGAAKDGDWDYVQNDIRAVVNASAGRALVKVIIEACLLTDEEKINACIIARQAGADFVKTSTGLSTGGATVEDVRLMRNTVGESMGVKAAGGIRDYETAVAMAKAGANRIGTSAGIKIVMKG